MVAILSKVPNLTFAQPPPGMTGRQYVAEVSDKCSRSEAPKKKESLTDAK
jgi:hypothetical protein